MKPIKLFFTAISATALAAICVSLLALSNAQAEDCGEHNADKKVDKTKSTTVAERVLERQNRRD